jgi:mannitol/fructose-specific phosphotransferase system IIA component (Ntr-type)
MRIIDFINSKAIVPMLKSTRKEDVIRELVTIAKKVYGLNLKIKDVTKKILKREKQGSTGLGGGVAIPHEKFSEIDIPYGVFGKTSKGIRFGAVDGEPVSMFFLVLCPQNNPQQHVKALQSIANLLNQPNFKRFLKNTKNVQEIVDLFCEFERKLTTAK